jgi:hypothetical protein
VSVTDPLSPFVGFRREVVEGVPLQIAEPLATFELLSKSTFAFAIYDELPVDAGPISPPLHRVFIEQRRGLAELFRRPKFWRYSSASDLVRKAPQETSPAKPADFVVVRRGSQPKPHPLRAGFTLRPSRGRLAQAAARNG